jgi:hypothetical protein
MRPDAPPAKQEGRYGDIVVRNSRVIKYKSDFSSATISGPDTVIDVPDKANKSNARIHADSIVMRQEGGQTAGLVDLSGNVTVHAVQRVDKGAERIIDATAGHGLYQRKEHRLTLDTGVQITIRDDARLDGPGKLSGDTVVVEMRKDANRYLVSGVPAHTRVDAPMRELSAAAEGPKSAPRPPAHAPVRTYRLQAYRFDEAELQVGRLARATGASSVFVVEDALDQSRAEIHSREVSAAYTEDGDAISQIHASSGARWLFTRPTPNARWTQMLSGRSGQVSYDPRTGGCLMAGGVQAVLTDPADLLKPATISADRMLAIPSGPAKARVYSYELSGLAARARIRFTPIPQPKPAAPAAKQAAAPAGEAGQSAPSAVGDVELAQFDSAVYVPSRRFDAHGPQLYVTTMDDESGVRTRFDSPTVTGSWAQNNLSTIEAVGGVRYSAVRPVDDPAGGRAQESLTGTAASANYTAGDGHRAMALHGSFDAELADPIDLEGPGRIRGDAGDTVRVDLSTTPYEFELDSPKQTATIDFQPRQKTAENAAHPSAGRSGKH